MFSFQQNIKRDAGNREVLQVHKKKKTTHKKAGQWKDVLLGAKIWT